MVLSCIFLYSETLISTRMCLYYVLAGDIPFPKFLPFLIVVGGFLNKKSVNSMMVFKSQIHKIGVNKKQCGHVKVYPLFLVEKSNFKKYLSKRSQTVNNQFKCSFEKYFLLELE